MCCPICLEEFTEEDNKITTSCIHTYHKQCLEKCMKVTLPRCPVCRINIKDDMYKLDLTDKPIEQQDVNEVVYYTTNEESEEEDDLRQSSPRNTGFFHRLVWG